MPRKPHARFLRWLAVLMAAFFAVTATLSTTVDPWRINQTRWSLASLDGAREISNTVRVGKAALANRGNWQVLILGSSRVEIGLDPSHPAFGGKRAVNLAMSAANLHETVPVGHYALDRNPQVDTVLLGIEAGDLHNDFDSRKYTRFHQSPFADNNRSIERGINQVIGGRALADSIATLQRHFRGAPPKRSPLGQWLRPNHPPDIRRYAETTFQMGFENSADEWNLRPQVLRPGKAAMLAGFLRRAREAGIAMHVFLPPQHALKLIHPTEDQPRAMAWETDLDALAAICREANARPATGPPVRLWSFLTFNEATTRPLPRPDGTSRQMPGWFDLGHAQPEVGRHVLETLFADRSGTTGPSAYGIDLLEGDPDARRAAWIEGHRTYCASRPEDVAWWRDLVARFWDPGKAPRPMADTGE